MDKSDDSFEIGACDHLGGNTPKKGVNWEYFYNNLPQALQYKRYCGMIKKLLKTFDINPNGGILRDSCARQGAFPQEYSRYFSGKHRSAARKDRERCLLSVYVNNTS